MIIFHQNSGILADTLSNSNTDSGPGAPLNMCIVVGPNELENGYISVNLVLVILNKNQECRNRKNKKINK